MMSAVATAPARQFLPREIDFADFNQIEPLYRQLLNRTLNSVSEIEKSLADFSELSAAIEEYGSRRYIDKSCHTDDPEIEKRFIHFVEEIEPKIKPLFSQLQKKFIDSPAISLLDEKRYHILLRKWRADVDLFRDENVALETEVVRLVTEYDKISGAMTVHFDGKELTMQQMARYGEQTDRVVRQKAWEAGANRRLTDRQPINAIFDQLLKIRQKIAENAGLENYREFTWKSLKRFDYTPEQCLEFADAVAHTCVPIVAELDARRANDLNVAKLRPWDLSVDPKHRGPLVPFRQGDTTEFIDKTRTIFQRLSPALADEFETLRTHQNLDLESRKGKQPGGYQCPLEESKQPFIFMNAAGLQRDVETLLHEGGHAFHYLAAVNEPLVFLRTAPMEFCEVASMSMELLGSEHFDVLYNEEDTARARRSMLEGIIRFFPWMSTIDSFQHWLYTHAGHSHDQRQTEWLRIVNQFSGPVDWTGYEPVREAMWQRQLHLFHSPFYYIEYGIAQLGALQLWLKAKDDPRKALANYRAALSLGGTRPLPDLFAAAGIRFDFSEKTLRPLMQAVGEELERLPT